MSTDRRHEERLVERLLLRGANDSEIVRVKTKSADPGDGGMVDAREIVMKEHFRVGAWLL